jgi:4-hydroxy-tetrahydrodipicolinate synthase
VADKPLFTGVGVALVTIFSDNGDVDAPATADLAGRLVELGARGVVVAGTTGEAASLDPDERTELLGAVRKVLVPGGPPLIAGTGAPSGRQAARLTAQAADAGADAVLALSPPGADDPRAYYAAVREAAGRLPVLGYHFPRASSPGISVDALPGLGLDGIKDSSGDAGRLLETLDRWDRPVYNGSPFLTSLAGSVGCAGVILALANAEPEDCAAAFAGDGAAQLRMAKARAAEMRFPAGIKELVSARFGFSARTRVG